jgi:hypothetical protein
MIAAAHMVVPLTLDFSADGKVSGASPDNGCNWLGVRSQGGKGLERMITLDVALTSCHYSGLDRRYTGTFLLARQFGPDESSCLYAADTWPESSWLLAGWDAPPPLTSAVSDV